MLVKSVVHSLETAPAMQTESAMRYWSICTACCRMLVHTVMLPAASLLSPLLPHTPSKVAYTAGMHVNSCCAGQLGSCNSDADE